MNDDERRAQLEQLLQPLDPTPVDVLHIGGPKHGQTHPETYLSCVIFCFDEALEPVVVTGPGKSTQRSAGIYNHAHMMHGGYVREWRPHKKTAL